MALITDVFFGYQFFRNKIKNPAFSRTAGFFLVEVSGIEPLTFRMQI
jgi:hypothetical protein